MDKIQKRKNSEYNASSSETFRIRIIFYLFIYFFYFLSILSSLEIGTDIDIISQLTKQHRISVEGDFSFLLTRLELLQKHLTIL
jgi:hypothetical protein